MRRLPVLLAVAIVLALGAASCGDDGEDGAAGTTTRPEMSTETAADDSALAQECTNEESGFSIRYPEGWHTNAGTVVAPCSMFHPQAFDVPEATELIGIAVATRREPVPIERILDGSAVTVVERREVTVAERDAVRRVLESTGEALLPEGVRTTQYLVDLDGETLVLETHDVGDLDYERNQEVLDAMVETLERTDE